MLKIIVDSDRRYGLLQDTGVCPAGWGETGSIGSPADCANEIEKRVHVEKQTSNNHDPLLLLPPVHHAEEAEQLAFLPRHCSFFSEWFLRNPNHYILPALAELNDSVNLGLLEQSLQVVFAHHKSLQAGFAPSEDTWSHFVLGFNKAISIFSISLAGVSDDNTEDVFEEIVLWAKSTLNITNGPVVRAVLFDMGSKQRHRLLVVFHHLLLDAFALGIVMKDVSMIYEQLLHNQQPSLALEGISSQDWVRQLTMYTTQDSAKKELKYWLNLPWDQIARLPIAVPNYNNPDERLDVWHHGSISNEHTLAIQYWVRLNGANIRAALLTALAQTFAAWTGRQTFLIEDVGHGRSTVVGHINVRRTIGWLVTHTPVILDIRETTSNSEMLTKINTHLSSIPLAGVGYSALRYANYNQEEMNQLKMLPHAQVLFNYFGYEPAVARDRKRDGLIRGILQCSGEPEGVVPPYSMLVRTYFRGNSLHFKFSCSDTSLSMPDLVEIFAEKLRSLAV